MNEKIATTVVRDANAMVEKVNRLAERGGRWVRAEVGDVYVVAGASDSGCEWLVVNRHPDDPDTILLVPVDQCPLLGVCDVLHQSTPNQTSYVARCGLGVWASVNHLKPDCLCDCGEGWEGVAKRCRAILADLARGRDWKVSEEQDHTENDPNYLDHCKAVARDGSYFSGGVL